MQTFHFNKILIILFLFTISVSTLIAKVKSLELTLEEEGYLKQNKIVKMCNNQNWAPIEFIDKNHNEAGIVIDILKLIEQKLDNKIKFEHIHTENWKQSQQFLREKRCDILSSAIQTSKREKYAIFTKPYLDYELAVITKNDKPFIIDLDDIADKSIARKTGSGLISKLEKKYPDINIIQTENYLESFQKVSSGEIYSTIATLPVAVYFINKYALSNLQIAGYTDLRYKLRIAVRKDKPILKTILDKALKQISKKEHREIFNKWSSPHIKEKINWNFILYGITIVIIIFILLGYRQYLLKKQHKELEKQYQYTNQILNSQTNFTIITDGEKIIQSNQTMLNFLGFKTMEEFLRKNSCICDFFVEEDGYLSKIKNGKKWIDIILEDLKILHQVKIKDLSGNAHIFQVNTKGKEPESDFFVFTFTDITDLILIKEKLQENEKRANAFSEVVNEAIVFSVNGTFIEANEAASRLTDYSYDEIIGKTIDRLFSPEDMAIVMHHISNDYDKPYDLQVIRKDGTKFHAEIYGNVFNYNGKDVRVTSVRDITERKQNEKKLLRLSQAVEQSSATVVITDLDGKIEYVNQKFVETTGYSKKEVIGENPRVLKSGEQSDAFYRELWQTISNGNMWEGEFHNKRKDNTLYWEHASIAPIFNKVGAIISYIATKEDVTLQKQAKLELIKAKKEAEIANKSKSEFLANMSHEIRTPMNGVIGMTELLLDTKLTVEQRDFAETVKDSANSLLGIINDILDFSKIEAGKLEMEIVAFDLKIFINRFIQVMKFKTEEKKLQLTSFISPKTPHLILGDPGRLKQILTNLISNAIKFTHEGGIIVNISLEIETDKDVLIRFSVKDSGIGISEKNQEKIFSKFTQADASTTRLFGGTGLGLAISKQLTELMGGEIGLISEEGKGSEFWFTALFLKQEEKTKPTVKKEIIINTNKEKRKNGSIRLLLAEDNKINQKVAMGILKKFNYSVDIVDNGAKAIELLAHRSYDLVLMDCQMPVMDGYEATRQIRNTKSEVLNHNIPVIAMTANAMSGDREECIVSGMDDYISKPVNPKLLIEIIEKWIDGSMIND